jgi:hypothetical protein
MAVALGVFTIVATAQDDPFTWLPLQTGSRLLYEHEWKSGDRNRPEVDRWTTEETITGRVTIPEGVVVVREVHMNGGNNHGALTMRAASPYLVSGNCIYVIYGGWDVRTQQLRPEYRKQFSEGAASPDFCVPLKTGAAWGNNDIPWRVEPARAGVGSFLPAQYAGAIHIFSDHFGSGGWEDVWFQKGVGVVGEHYIHNGTYDEYTKKLRPF